MVFHSSPQILSNPPKLPYSHKIKTSHSLIFDDPGAFWGGCAIDVSFITKHSIVFYSLHLGLLLVSIYLKKEASLMRVERFTTLWINH